MGNQVNLNSTLKIGQRQLETGKGVKLETKLTAVQYMPKRQIWE